MTDLNIYTTTDPYFIVRWNDDEGKRESHHASESSAFGKAREISKKVGKSQAAKIVNDFNAKKQNVLKLVTYEEGKKADEKGDGESVLKTFSLKEDPAIKESAKEAKAREKQEAADAKAKAKEDAAAAKAKAKADRAAAKQAKPKKEKTERQPGMRQPESREPAQNLNDFLVQFGCREETNRTKVLRTFYKSLNKQVDRRKLLTAVYGNDDAENVGPLSMVLYGISGLIAGKSLPYELRKEAGEARGEMSIGIHVVG